MYRHLDLERIAVTIERLRRRIRERFPDSNLGRVAAELIALAGETRGRIEDLRRPVRWIRGLVLLIVALIIVAAAGAIWVASRIASGPQDISAFLQGLDAAVNEIILLGGAIYFLLTLERRTKRRIVLRGLHELRSIAHVIDAHQLTKDPESVLFPGAAATESSPERSMTRFELSRYLDYCSELLSLTAKLAALYAQADDDPATLSAVNDVELLTGSLSAKIWQKVTILERPGQPDAMASSAPGGPVG